MVLIPTSHNPVKILQFWPLQLRRTRPHSPTNPRYLPQCLFACSTLSKALQPRLDFRGNVSQHDFTEVGHLRAWAFQKLSPVTGQGLENLSTVLGRIIVALNVNVVDRKALLAIEASQDVTRVFPACDSSISAFYHPISLARCQQEALHTSYLKVPGTFKIDSSRSHQFFAQPLHPKQRVLSSVQCVPDHSCFKAFINRVSLCRHLRYLLKSGSRSPWPHVVSSHPYCTEAQP